MYFCKSRNHVWSNKADAEKCCNGYTRKVVVGKRDGASLPEEARIFRIDEEQGLMFGRIWIKEKAEQA